MSKNELTVYTSPVESTFTIKDDTVLFDGKDVSTTNEKILDGDILTVGDKSPRVDLREPPRGRDELNMLVAAAASISLGSMFVMNLVRPGYDIRNRRSDWDDPIESLRLTSLNSRSNFRNNLSRQLTKKSKAKEIAHDEKRDARKRQKDARKKNRKR